jgi:hypothetical protein
MSMFLSLDDIGKLRCAVAGRAVGAVAHRRSLFVRASCGRALSGAALRFDPRRKSGPKFLRDQSGATQDEPKAGRTANWVTD